MKTHQAKVSPIIEEVVIEIYNNYPELMEKYGEAGKVKCREDNQHHFDHLETTYQVNNPDIFIDYALWLNNVLTARGMKTVHLIDNFKRIEHALTDKLDADREVFYRNVLNQAVTALNEQRNASGREG